MLKKLISTFMVVFIVVTAMSVSVFSTWPPVDVVVEVGSVVANNGSIVKIPIMVKDIPKSGLTNLDFLLTFDTSCLEVISLDPGEVLKNPSTDFYTSFNNDNGRMVFMFTDETGKGERKITEEGEFAIITARVNWRAKEGYSEINLGTYYGGGFIKGGVLIEYPKVTIEVETVKGLHYDLVKIPLNLTAVPTQGIGSLDLVLEYNPDDLDVLSIEAGDIIEKPQMNFATDIKKDGRLFLMYTDESGIGTYSIRELGVYAIITARIKKEAKIGLSEISLRGVNGNVPYESFSALFSPRFEYIKGGVEIEDPKVTIEVAKVKGNPGDIVKIPLNLTTMPTQGINNLDFILAYNPDDLDVLSIEAGDIIENSHINLATHINKDGRLVFMYTDESGIGTYKIRKLGVYATITVRIKQEAKIGLSEITLNRSGSIGPLTPLYLMFIKGGVEIENNHSKMLGDLNGDGVINSTDYVLLKRYILEVDKNLPVNDISLADLNRDGKIDSVDYTLLRRYILEIISDFPAN